jgi:hypothetical protein
MPRGALGDDPPALRKDHEGGRRCRFGEAEREALQDVEGVEHVVERAVVGKLFEEVATGSLGFRRMSR